MNIMLIILIDWISLLFVRIVLLISSLIIIYRTVYINIEKFLNRFWYLVLLFIFSIILMVIRPRILSILFGWDGLGIVSYCLVIYYHNYISYNSGIITVLRNRVGDIGLLVSIRLLRIRGRWNLWIYNDCTILITLMLFLAAITKRAQIPFSSWLPMAIAAPTPVSALVHSSTLVTAGVYLIIRYNELLMRSGLNYYLMYLSVLTIFMSGIIANFEYDLKKIIALSTLSQLGLIIIILSLGFNMLAFFHLLVHAVFKSILFMCAGVIIHSMNNRQDIRLIGNLNNVIPFTIIRFMISTFALCGFPFISGFYSKDLIIEIIYISRNNFLLLAIIVISLRFTVIYRVRLVYYLYFMGIKFYRFINLNENRIMNLSMCILVLLRVLVGSILSWIFFFDFYIVILCVDLKILTLFICIVGVVICILRINFIKTLINFYYLVYYNGFMWFLNIFYNNVYCVFNLTGLNLYLSDKVWVEFFSKYKLLDLIFYKINILDNFYFYIYIFINIFIFFIILVFLIL